MISGGTSCDWRCNISPADQIALSHWHTIREARQYQHRPCSSDLGDLNDHEMSRWRRIRLRQRSMSLSQVKSCYHHANKIGSD